MNVEERFQLITKNAQEVLTEERLRDYLEKDIPLRHYIGFEISGEIHLGTGIQCMAKVADFQKAGVECILFLADWHSWINDKLGGDIEIIRSFAYGYFAEGLKACLKAVGGDPDAVRVVLGSDLYRQNPDFWTGFVEVCKNTTLNRILRSITILGRSEGESVDFAKLVYPPMQVADIYTMGVNLAHAGQDQRKAHVIALDVANQMKTMPLKDREGNNITPIAIHHHLLSGLGKPPMWPIDESRLQEVWTAMKMSKSKPDTAVFVTDEPDDIKRKIKKAFCPEGEIAFNPVLDWANRLIFALGRGPLRIERKEEHGGNLQFATYAELEQVFAKKELHPLDLKVTVADSVIDLLAPVREHFAKPEIRKVHEALKQTMKKVKLR
ncbi:MAG: tyrosine--tRNA ligase [Candidatus Omnitrophota bacterium]|jgi:tyrosyl-tRNA synthetase|nr:MAG: tyrosine--tRNA ligase [Candidatus Omnitrophota bacterium]